MFLQTYTNLPIKIFRDVFQFFLKDLRIVFLQGKGHNMRLFDETADGVILPGLSFHVP